MEKPNDVSITQITSAAVQNARGNPNLTVHGLGDDQKIYVWSPDSHTWRLFA